MTLADPKGRPVDRLRNCYASWMNTPDAGLIRVRWYRVPEPEPGTYELTDYCSSNYDPEPHSYDPGVGEQSTSRDPFADYRDCCAPPWAHPSLANCPGAKAPAFATYHSPAIQWQSNVFGPTIVGKQSLPAYQPCGWRVLNVLVGGVLFSYTLNIHLDGSATLTALAVTPGPLNRVAFYASQGPIDPGGPFVLHLRTSGPPASLIGPPSIRFTGTDPAYMLVSRCVWLKVADSTYLRLE